MNDFKLSAFIRYQKSFSNILKMKTKSPPLTGFEPTPCWGQKHARKLLKRAYLGRALRDEIVPCIERLDKGLAGMKGNLPVIFEYILRSNFEDVFHSLIGPKSPQQYCLRVWVSFWHQLQTPTPLFVMSGL